jgi:hypothetical protein
MANRETIASILAAALADPFVCLYDRWSFESVGDVFALDLLTASLESATDYGPIGNSITSVRPRLALTSAGVAWLASHDAARAAARQRRSAAARGRSSAARSVGLTRTRAGGWE